LNRRTKAKKNKEIGELVSKISGKDLYNTIFDFVEKSDIR